MKLNDYFKRVKNFDEILENEKVSKIIKNELDYEVITITKIDELYGIYYFSGKVLKNEESFQVTIMFSANENYKNFTLRIEGINSPLYMLFDTVYTIKSGKFFMQMQKGDMQGENYYIEHLIDNGSRISYISELYDYKKVESLVLEKHKSMFFINDLQGYCIDRLVIDNAYHDEMSEYKITHNGINKYIKSDKLEESIEDLLSHDIHIALLLK